MASFDLGIRIKKKIVNFLIQKIFKLILLYQLQVKTIGGQVNAKR